MNLTEATMLALQNKLEEVKVNEKLNKKTENKLIEENEKTVQDKLYGEVSRRYDNLDDLCKRLEEPPYKIYAEDYIDLQAILDVYDGVVLDENREVRGELNKKTEDKEQTDTNIADTFRNYNAFKNNFGDIIIVKSKYDNEYYFYKTDEDFKNNNYFNHTPSKDYVEGWLYGAVQANNKVVSSIR